MVERDRVIVVGAGIAGLVLARDLARSGLPVLVLEAGERPGGQVASTEVAGVVVDAASDSIGPRSPALAELCAELSLATESPAALPTWLVGSDGRAAPTPADTVLGIPAFPFAPDVAGVIGVAGSWRALLDKLVPMLRPEKYPSLAALVQQRLGRRVLERLVEPIVRGCHSAAPDALPIDVVSAELRPALRTSGSLAAAIAEVARADGAALEPVSIVGGVRLLAERLGELVPAYGAELRTGVRVESATAGSVVTADGETLTGRVVVAAPGLATAVTRRREVAVAVAAVRSEALDAAPRGTDAFVAADAPGIAARTFTHASAKWPSLRESFGAAGDQTGHRHLVRLSYDAVPSDPATQVLADLRAITGAADIEIDDVSVGSWTRVLAVAPTAPGDPLVVGEAASRIGIAAIVADARALAERLVAGDREETAR